MTSMARTFLKLSRFFTLRNGAKPHKLSYRDSTFGRQSISTTKNTVVSKRFTNLRKIPSLAKLTGEVLTTS
jgi:hypothetical protein